MSLDEVIRIGEHAIVSRQASDVAIFEETFFAEVESSLEGGGLSDVKSLIHAIYIAEYLNVNGAVIDWALSSFRNQKLDARTTGWLDNSIGVRNFANGDVLAANDRFRQASAFAAATDDRELQSAVGLNYARLASIIDPKTAEHVQELLSLTSQGIQGETTVDRPAASAIRYFIASRSTNSDADLRARAARSAIDSARRVTEKLGRWNDPSAIDALLTAASIARDEAVSEEDEVRLSQVSDSLDTLSSYAASSLGSDSYLAVIGRVNSAQAAFDLALAHMSDADRRDWGCLDLLQAALEEIERSYQFVVQVFGAESSFSLTAESNFHAATLETIRSTARAGEFDRIDTQLRLKGLSSRFEELIAKCRRAGSNENAYATAYWGYACVAFDLARLSDSHEEWQSAGAIATSALQCSSEAYGNQSYASRVLRKQIEVCRFGSADRPYASGSTAVATAIEDDSWWLAFDSYVTARKAATPSGRDAETVGESRTHFSHPGKAVEFWPTDVIRTAISEPDESAISEIIGALERDPFGRTARQCDEITITLGRNAPVMQAVHDALTAARQKLVEREKLSVMHEVNATVKQSGLSLHEFAQQLGIGDRMLAGYMSARPNRGPSARMMTRIRSVGRVPSSSTYTQLSATEVVSREIAELLARSGLSQREFASRADIPIENLRSYMDPNTSASPRETKMVRMRTLADRFEQQSSD